MPLEVREFLFPPLTPEYRGKMSNFYEDLIRPNEYVHINNVTIQKPPLILTSLSELAKAGWSCWIEARRLLVEKRTKIRLRFIPPNGGPSGLNFNIWGDFLVGNRDQAMKILENLDTITEPNNLTARVTTFEAVYNTVNSVQSFSDMLVAASGEELEMFEHEILKKINEKRAERIVMPEQAMIEEPDHMDLTMFFERVFADGFKSEAENETETA